MGIIVETSYFCDLKQVDEPKVLVIPTPYEYTTTYIKGTRNATQAILNASKHIEFFDDELWTDVSKIGINTTNFINSEFVNNDSSQPFSEVEDGVRKAVIGGSLPVVIGGEHSISYGSIKAAYDLYPELSVLHLGSMPNLKSSVQNNNFNRQCVFRQIYETMPDLKVVHLGTRVVSKEEKEWLETTTSNTEIFWGRDKNTWNIAEILSSLTKNVFLSVDFSVLDINYMPTVTNPDPGGLSWEEVTNILKNVCTFKDIVGMDFVEYSPVENLKGTDFLAAKFIYKVIGYAFARALGVFEEEKSSLVANEG